MGKAALLFDIGNVLLTFDFEPTWKHFSEKSGKPVQEIKTLLQPLKEALESGQLPSEDFVSQSMAVLEYKDRRDDFIYQWGNIFALNAPMRTFIEQLNEDFELYLFSNTSGLHKDFMFEHFEVFQRFQGGIYSHEAKAMKPAPRMYELAVSELGLDPARTLYIDDLPENIETGKAFGYHTHIYDFRRHDVFESTFQNWKRLMQV